MKTLPLGFYSEREKLEQMVGILEDEGLFLWFDSEKFEWSIFPGEEFLDDFENNPEIFSIVGPEKEKVIRAAFRSLMH